MINYLTYFCLILGLIFWLWGTPVLLQKRSIFYKLHSLSVSDTLGSILIITGLCFKLPSELPWLILAIMSLTIWNTMLGYVIAYSVNNDNESE
jgi:multicomponent Na+:H+ antiporter subunit G